MIARVRIMFVPASGPIGTGEYYRCLALARTLKDRRPDVEIDFLLNRHANVERDDRFVYHELSATPARAGEEVLDCLIERRPALAVFDCSGRVRQYRAAREAGTRVVWISNRPRKRLKGFRPRQMRWLNLHVVVESQPKGARLGIVERLMLRCFPDVEIVTAGAIVAQPDEAALEPWANILPDGDFGVFVAGGGGYRHDSRPVSEIFLEAAQRFCRDQKRSAVVVMGPQYTGDARSAGGVTVVRSMPTAALGALLARARLAVIGAGNMLSSQTLAAGTPCVITAVGGKDQPRRVRQLSRARRAVGADLSPDALARAAEDVWCRPDNGDSTANRSDPTADVDRVVDRLLAQLEA